MAELSYPFYIRELGIEDGGGYQVFVPDLIGCMADGETIEEAVAEARSAIGEWIDEARRLGRKIPEPYEASRRQAEQREALWKVIDQQDEILKSKDELLAAKETVIQAKEAVLKEMRAELDDMKQRDVDVGAMFNGCTRVFSHRVGGASVLVPQDLPGEGDLPRRDQSHPH